MLEDQSLMIEFAEKHEELLNDWECKFIDTVSNQLSLSPKQDATLIRITNKLIDETGETPQ